MKVRELIKLLEKLDLDSDIWILYDGVEFVRPEIDVVDEDVTEYKNHIGDYYFMAW